jgi:hypothetical protein
MNFVWVFNGERSSFPSGIFSSREKAETWIAANGVSGCLTMYPVDESAYDWAIREGHFSPQRDDQRTPEFIARFSSGAVHFHFENGQAR